MSAVQIHPGTLVEAEHAGVGEAMMPAIRRRREGPVAVARGKETFLSLV
jgi:hypothetical protein